MSAEQPTVVLEVYSGRENPSWTLEGDNLQAVRDRIREADARTGDRVSPPTPVLGYRGFRIENLGPDAPDAVLVGRGVISLIRGKQAEHRPDSDDLEGLLLAEAARQGHRELLQAAGAPRRS